MISKFNTYKISLKIDQMDNNKKMKKQKKQNKMKI